MNLRLTAVAVYSIAFIFSASATGNTVSLTLDQCIDKALNDGLSVKAGRLSLDKAEALKGTAFDVDKTAVTLGQIVEGGIPDNGLTVSQDFEFPTVYIARHKVLKAEAELQQSSLDLARAKLTRDVTATYHSMLSARKSLRIRQMQDSLYRQFVAVADAKYDNGEISRLDQINVSRAYSVNSIELERAANAYMADCRAMAVLLDIDSPVEPAETDPHPIDASVIPAGAVEFAATPEGNLSAKQLLLSERNLALARQGYMPGISVAATTQLFIKGFNPYGLDRQPFKDGSFAGFEVGVTLPIFFGSQRAKTRAAQKDVEIARIMRQQAEVKAQKEYADMLGNYATARRNLDYYMTTAIPQADEITQLSEASYEAGEIGYAEHLQNLENAMQIRLLWVEALNEYNQTVIQLKFLQGNQQ